MTDDVYDFQETEKENQKVKNAWMIDGQYGISVLPVEYALVKKQLTKTGNVHYKTIAFCGSVIRCLNCYLDQVIHDRLAKVKDGATIADMAEEIREAVDDARRAIYESIPQYEVTEID